MNEPLDSKKSKENGGELKTPSSKNGLQVNMVRVPKQEAVVSVKKDASRQNEKEVKQKLKKHEKELNKQKKNALKEEAKRQKQLKREQLREQKQKDLAEKLKKTEEQKAYKSQNKQNDKKNVSSKKTKKSKKSAEDRFGLNDINELENRLLHKKETEQEKKKKIIIIILIILLTIMIGVGSCTAIEIIDDQRPDPIEVIIRVESEGVKPQPIDPNNPELGYYKITVYPGDTIDSQFFVFNEIGTEDFPMYVRFRCYIEIEGVSEHFIFNYNFSNPDFWFEGVGADDWYYYGGAVPTGIENRLQIIDNIVLRTDLGNYFQGKDFSIVYEVQGIQGVEEAVEGFSDWWLAPEEWYNYMESNDWFRYLMP